MEGAGKAAADLEDRGVAARGRGAAGTLTSACCRGSAPAPRSRRRNPRGPGSAPGAARRGCRRRPGPPRPPAPAAALGAPRRPSTPQPGRPSPAGRRPAPCPAVGAPGTRRCPGRELCAPSRSPGRRDAPQCEPERGQGRPPARRVLLIPAERSALSEGAGPGPGRRSTEERRARGVGGPGGPGGTGPQLPLLDVAPRTPAGTGAGSLGTPSSPTSLALWGSSWLGLFLLSYPVSLALTLSPKATRAKMGEYSGPAHLEALIQRKTLKTMNQLMLVRISRVEASLDTFQTP